MDYIAKLTKDESSICPIRHSKEDMLQLIKEKKSEGFVLEACYQAPQITPITHEACDSIKSSPDAQSYNADTFAYVAKTGKNVTNSFHDKKFGFLFWFTIILLSLLFILMLWCSFSSYCKEEEKQIFIGGTIFTGIIIFIYTHKIKTT